MEVNCLLWLSLFVIIVLFEQKDVVCAKIQKIQGDEIFSEMPLEYLNLGQAAVDCDLPKLAP